MILQLGLLLFSCTIENGLHSSIDENTVEKERPWITINDPTEPTDMADTGFQPWTAYDVLIVLDTSGSMADDTLIHFGLAQIPEELNAHNSDWKIAMIAADASRTELWEVPQSDPDPEWAVMEGIQYLLNTRASYEEGIDASLAFLARNPDWFRTEATTLLIYISDEDDQSEADPVAVNTFWPNVLKIVAVVGLETTKRNPNGNSNYYCSAQVGERYLQIATRSIDICSTARWSVF